MRSLKTNHRYMHWVALLLFGLSIGKILAEIWFQSFIFKNQPHTALQWRFFFNFFGNPSRWQFFKMLSTPLKRGDWASGYFGKRHKNHFSCVSVAVFPISRENKRCSVQKLSVLTSRSIYLNVLSGKRYNWSPRICCCCCGVRKRLLLLLRSAEDTAGTFHQLSIRLCCQQGRWKAHFQDCREGHRQCRHR